MTTPTRTPEAPIQRWITLARTWHKSEHGDWVQWDDVKSLCQELAQLREERDALRKENIEQRARAVVAEQHKALDLMGRSSYAEVVEDKLRTQLAETELRAEAAEAALAQAQQDRERLTKENERLRALLPREHTVRVVSMVDGSPDAAKTEGTRSTSDATVTISGAALTPADGDEKQP